MARSGHRHPLYNEDVIQLHNKQEALGPHSITWGFWHPSVLDALVTSWDENDKRSPHKKWLATLSNMIWRITEQLWLHFNATLRQEDNLILQQESKQNMQDTINLFMEIVGLPLTMFPVSNRPFFKRYTLHQILAKPLEESSRKKWLRQATNIMNSY